MRTIAAVVAAILLTVSGTAPVAASAVPAAATGTPAAATGAPAAATAAVAARWRLVEIAAPLNAKPDPVATLDAVACEGAGSCYGGGSYQSKSGAVEPMIAAQTRGVWRRARELLLPGNAFAANPDAAVSSVACTSSGSCVAVGGYAYDSDGLGHAFTAAESAGNWARGRPVTLPANAAARAGDATLGAVTCTGAGSCVAVGGYLDTAGSQELMVVTESRGRWGRARQLAAPKNAAVSAGASLDGVSCWRPGDCWAVGSYTAAAGHGQALAVAQTGGRWARATEIGAPPDAGQDPGTQLTGVACSRAGACTAAGGYFDAAAASHALVVSTSRHGWARAIEIKAPAVRAFVAPFLNGISCVAAGTCAAVGSYLDNVAAVPMAVIRLAGRWQGAGNVPAPGNALTGKFRDATLLSVACLGGHSCTALGWYVDKAHRQEAMAAASPAP